MSVAEAPAVAPLEQSPDAAGREIGPPVQPSAPHVRETWSAFWRSRVLVWVVGCVAFLLLPTSSGDPAWTASAFGSLGNVLAAPAVRWDAVWYLQIAQHGYQTARVTAFYPLYPLVARAVSLLTGSISIAGIVVSLAGLFAGLLILRRLTALELGEKPASAAVQLLAFSPVAVFLSAIYSEGLFLALSVATIYAARRGRWALAGVVGALAAVTRVTGVVLLVPVLLLFLYGPRCDAAPTRSSDEAATSQPRGSRASSWLRSGRRPRYRITPAILWSALIPAAAAVFAAYLAIRGFGATGTLDAQQQYSGHLLVLPVVGIWDGVIAGWRQLQIELAGVHTGGLQTQALFQLGALIIACLGVAGCVRRLPFAYAAYAICGLLVALSAPTAYDPLRGLARYATVLFPLYMCAGSWATEQGARRRLLIGSALLMVLFTVQFATGNMVGTPVL